MRFILVRHCETDWNVEKRLQGHTDIELNNKGRDQAKNLVEKIIPLGVNRIVSSDLKRAVQSAEVLSSHLQIPILLDERLRECKFGKLEGLTWPEIEQTFNIKKESLYRGAEYHYDHSVFDGEGRNSVAERHKKVLNDLVRLYPDETILLVGHDGGLNTLLSEIGYTTGGLKRGEYIEINYS